MMTIVELHIEILRAVSLKGDGGSLKGNDLREHII